LEDEQLALEELFDEIDSVGINAYFYAIIDDISAAREIIFDALRQMANVHVYASYDDSFEVNDPQQLYEIIQLNMKSELGEAAVSALHNWIDDVVMHLAVGAVSLDRFIEINESGSDI
jgi:hypothetical protein